MTVNEFIGLIDRINQGLKNPPKDTWEEATKPPLKGETDRPFPGIKVGDFLYRCGDTEEGIVRKVVLFVDSNDHALVVECPEVPRSMSWLRWAGAHDFKTEAEALADGARGDIDYHWKRVEWARKAARAAAEGGDLSPFREEVNLDKDD